MYGADSSVCPPYHEALDDVLLFLRIGGGGRGGSRDFGLALLSAIGAGARKETRRDIGGGGGGSFRFSASADVSGGDVGAADISA